MLLHVLDGLERAQRFVNVAAKREVVYGGVLYGALEVDDEQATKGNTILREHAVAAANGALKITYKRVGHVTNAALAAIRLGPGKVAEVAVNANTKHLGVELLELGVAVAEGGDLGRAYEGEVKRVEEEDDVLVTDILVQ